MSRVSYSIVLPSPLFQYTIIPPPSSFTSLADYDLPPFLSAEMLYVHATANRCWRKKNMANLARPIKSNNKTLDKVE